MLNNHARLLESCSIVGYRYDAVVRKRTSLERWSNLISGWIWLLSEVFFTLKYVLWGIASQ